MTDPTNPDQLSFDDADEPVKEWDPLWILDGLRPGEFPDDQGDD